MGRISTFAHACRTYVDKLFFNLHFDQVEDFSNEAQFVLPAWAQVTFDEQAARLIGPEQIHALEKLSEFKFVNNEQFPFPDEFLRDLANFIRQRAEKLASLPPVSREELLSHATRKNNKGSIS